jgi:hypothetical protein
MFFLLCGSAMAQTVSFIHIQSENNRAFNVQWKGNTYPSSATGYLVIPQITAGEHTLVFSFQDTSLPAYSFTLTMDDKPRGFSLRQSISNTWSLFDMVSFTVTKGAEKPKPKEEKPVLVITQPAEPEKKSLPLVDTTAKTLSVPVTVTITEKPAPAKMPGSTEPPIQKIFDKANTSGIDQVYIIINKGKADTIAIFIPALKEETPKQSAFKGKPESREVDLAMYVSGAAWVDRFKLSIK